MVFGGLIAASGLKAGEESIIVPFGDKGAVKMLYDARQRPQAVYLNDQVFLVYNGDARMRDSNNSKRKSESVPVALRYDPKSRTLSSPLILSENYSSDHHDGPVVWVDTNDRLHVFYGWHHDLGSHIVSDQPMGIGSGHDDWSESTAPSQKMSYQWTRRVHDDKQLVFYRTDGHYSSWTYRISSDNGVTWKGPAQDVLDLDMHLGMDTDWSTYTAKEISPDGRFLHLAFVAYDDYKRPVSAQERASGELDERRLQNPLYGNRVPSNYKYNLYYVKIDLQTHEVVNGKGEMLQTPIDRTTANNKCMIWDTKWRGAGVPPSILVGDNDEVSFLHNLSDVHHEESLSYHYVRRVKGEWTQTRITGSNHHWNSGLLSRSQDGALHAYVPTGEGYLDVKGEMDRYGGGRAEEWVSQDQGYTWRKRRELFASGKQYPSWKYNNVQAVRHPNGTVVDGMLIFYGWRDPVNPVAQAFLLHEDQRAYSRARTDSK